MSETLHGLRPWKAVTNLVGCAEESCVMHLRLVTHCISVSVLADGASDFLTRRADLPGCSLTSVQLGLLADRLKG